MFKLTYDDLKGKRKEELIAYILEDKRDKVSGITDTMEMIRGVNINYDQENVILMCLDTANNVLKVKNLFKGRVASTTIDMKIIFMEILKTKSCTRIIVAHNYPSGNLTPSYKDKDLTSAIKEAAELFGIRFLDHIVFSRKDYLSFLSEGLMD